ncbi:ribokinase [Microdochium nivale]|nr:ribokinase [Microdochium nivale]
MTAEEEPPVAYQDDLSAAAADVSIDFVTLGMFIIDDIEYLPPKPSVTGILGGAGSYAALGARLFSPPPISRSVGWVVDKGSDFPENVEEAILSWDTSVLLRPTPDRLTTRGWNGYDEHQNRAFKYTSPKRRLTADDLDSSLITARSFHLICSPNRCRELVNEIRSRRSEVAGKDGTNLPKPIFIWEPVPDLCTPDELLNCTNTLPLVDICSPNHSELAGFMGDDGLDPETGEISTRAIERACEQLLGSMPLQSFSLVVRAGEKGCYLARNGGRKRKLRSIEGRRKKPAALLHGPLRPEMDMEALFAGLMQDSDGSVTREEIEVDPGVERWIPAYHTDKDKVVDPTGGGNAFLGGLAVALARGKSLEEAAAWGTVAASFAIEQVGMPTLGQETTTYESGEGTPLHEEEDVQTSKAAGEESADAAADDGPDSQRADVDASTSTSARETWNGAVVEERFQEFKTRLAFS